MEKITFIYPHQVQDSKQERVIQQPDVVIKVSSNQEIVDIGITFGLFIKPNNPYKFSADVFYCDKSVMDADRAMSFEPLFAASPSIDEYLSIESINLIGLNLKNQGVHKIVASVYSLLVPDEDEIPLHTAECYFFVHKI